MPLQEPKPSTRSRERHLGGWTRARLPFALAELGMILLKQGWACLRGGLLLLAIIATKLIWQAGSWSYPESGVFKLMGVPLFSGFMSASVGSYMARVTRIFDRRFAPYPPFWMTALLRVAIYVNVFAHHFLHDARQALFAATGAWLYSGQMPGQWVSFAKLGSWYLLQYVAFVTVTVVIRSAISREELPVTRAPESVAAR